MSGLRDKAQGAGFLFILLIASIVYFLCFSNSVQATTITQPKPGVPVALTIPDTDLEISGCVGASSLVSIKDGGSIVASVTSNSVGKYTKTLFSQTPTIHAINTYFEDVDGLVSTQTTDLIALPEKTLTSVVIDPPPTVKHSPSSVQIGQLITFTGYACPGSTVKIVIDGNTTLTAKANTKGKWSASINAINFSRGAHSFVVSASGSGYSTPDSLKKQFIVVAPSSKQSPVTEIENENAIDLDVAVEILAPKDGFRSIQRDVLVSGTGPPNSQIELYVDGGLAGSVFANSMGEWSLVLSVLKPQQALSARACDEDKCGVLSKTVNVFFDSDDNVPGVAICNLKIMLERYRFTNLAVNKGIDLEFMIEGGSDSDPRFDVVTDWGDLVIEHQTLDKHDATFHHIYNQIGNYNGSLAVQNESGCRDVVYFSVQVVAEESNISSWILLFIGLLTIFAYMKARSRGDLSKLNQN